MTLLGSPPSPRSVTFVVVASETVWLKTYQRRRVSFSCEEPSQVEYCLGRNDFTPKELYPKGKDKLLV